MSVSRFTPSMMKHEDLESILVQRHQLAKQIVDAIRESAVTSSKHHTLLIGSRGMGKTYLVSLVYHRIHNLDDCKNRLLIAWLREEEWGVTSFLDLLLRIFRALKEEYGDGLFSKELAERLESLYNLSPDAAERAGVALLKEIIGDKTLLLLMENLDELFAGLGKEGQKQFHSFLQKNACTTLATAQRLLNSIEIKNSPFYKFFDIHKLERLIPAQATQLLANIARLEGKTDLESFIRSPRGRDRIKAVDSLAGGNPRIYVIFFEFLTRESLDKLVEPFMRTLDNLTPYYQARMAWLSPQQRKIIEFLCDRRYPVTVKEIAQRCFVTHQTASSQLKDLKEKGYVNSEAIGRESFYGLREILMRFCLEVKKQRGEPIRLFVDFLRLQYTRAELQQLLGMDVAEISKEQMFGAGRQQLSAAPIDDYPHAQNHPKEQQSLEPLPPTAVREREYLLYALQLIEEDEEDPRLAAYWQQWEEYLRKENYLQALQSAQKLVDIRGDIQDWFAKGICLCGLEHYEEALKALDKAIEKAHVITHNFNDHPIWFQRGWVLENLNRYEEALLSYNKAIELEPDKAVVWLQRSWVLYKLERYKEALASYDKVIELEPDVAMVWNIKGWVLYKLERYEEALASYNKAVELDPYEGWAWDNRGDVLKKLERYEEALASYSKAIEIDPNYYSSWFWQGDVLNKLERYEEALASYTKVIEINPNEPRAWFWQGDVLNKLERYEKALVSYNKAIEIDPNYYPAWLNRGDVLDKLERYEEALASYNKAFEFDSNEAVVWNLRGCVLYKLERYEEALASYNKALELDPNEAWAWENRGHVLKVLKSYEDALTSYDKALELDPHDYWTWYSRGDVLKELERYQEALTSYDKAIELEPDCYLTWFWQSVVLTELKHYEEALISLQKVIELEPNLLRAWGGRGALLAELKRYQEALLCFDKVIEIEPNLAMAWYARGALLVYLGRYDEALVSCDKVLALSDESLYVFFIRAIALLALNRWDESITILDDALNRIADGEEPDTEGAKLIISILFNSTQDATIWKSRLTTLIELFDKHKFLAILGQGVVQNIPALMSEMVSDKAAETWLEVWRELVGDVSEFVIPLRLLNAAVRYKITKGDRRVLLELPIEERNLLQPLLETDTSGD